MPSHEGEQNYPAILNCYFISPLFSKVEGIFPVAACGSMTDSTGSCAVSFGDFFILGCCSNSILFSFQTLISQDLLLFRQIFIHMHIQKKKRELYLLMHYTSLIFILLNNNYYVRIGNYYIFNMIKK